MEVSGRQGLLSLVAIITLITGIAAGGYVISEQNNDAGCSSCLGLSEYSPGFKEWWGNYPEDSPLAGDPVPHPQPALDALETHEVVMVFFWGASCAACHAQWDDMQDEGIVVGEEGAGSMGANWQDVALFDFDYEAGEKAWYNIYIDYSEHKVNQIPMTAFITEIDGEVVWFASMSKMEASEVEFILLDALDNEEHH